MGPLLVLLLIIGVPIAELYVFVQVTHAIGFFNSLLVLAAISVVGGWLVKRQGLRVLRRFTAQAERGVVPSREIADGVALLVAGALLLTPGFITDALGALLFVPPVRGLVRGLVSRRARGQHVVTATYSGPLAEGGVIDAGSEERD